MRMRLSEEKNHKIKDPFDGFGHGIKTYFRTMKILMYLFTGLTVLFIPVMSLYSSYDELSATGGLGVKYMLGNIGQRSAFCYFQSLSFNKTHHHKCATGTFGPIMHVGLHPEKLIEQHDFCSI